MKRLLIILCVLAITVTTQAQTVTMDPETRLAWGIENNTVNIKDVPHHGIFAGFGLPLKDNPVYEASSVKALTAPAILLRPAFSMTGTVSYYNRLTNNIESEGFLRPSAGVSLSFSKKVNDVPYEYLALNLLAIIPTQVEKMSYAVTVSAFKLLNLDLKPQIGVIVDPNKFKTDYVPVGFLTGLKYTF